METHLNHDRTAGVWHIWTNVPSIVGWLRKLECATGDPTDYRKFTVPDTHVRSIRYLFRPCDRPGYRKSERNPYHTEAN